MHRFLSIPILLAIAANTAIPCDWNPIIKAVADVIALGAAYFFGRLHQIVSQQIKNGKEKATDVKAPKPSTQR